GVDRENKQVRIREGVQGVCDVILEIVGCCRGNVLNAKKFHVAVCVHVVHWTVTHEPGRRTAGSTVHLGGRDAAQSVIISDLNLVHERTCGLTQDNDLYMIQCLERQIGVGVRLG